MKNTRLKNFEKIFNATLRKNIKSIQKEFDKMRSLANLLDESSLEFKDKEDNRYFYCLTIDLQKAEAAMNYFNTKEDTKIYFKDN